MVPDTLFGARLITSFVTEILNSSRTIRHSYAHLATLPLVKLIIGCANSSHRAVCIQEAWLHVNQTAAVRFPRSDLGFDAACSPALIEIIWMDDKVAGSRIQQVMFYSHLNMPTRWESPRLPMRTIKNGEL